MIALLQANSELGWIAQLLQLGVAGAMLVGMFVANKRAEKTEAILTGINKDLADKIVLLTNQFSSMLDKERSDNHAFVSMIREQATQRLDLVTQLFTTKISEISKDVRESNMEAKAASKELSMEIRACTMAISHGFNLKPPLPGGGAG